MSAISYEGKAFSPVFHSLEGGDELVETALQNRYVFGLLVGLFARFSSLKEEANRYSFLSELDFVSSSSILELEDDLDVEDIEAEQFEVQSQQIKTASSIFSKLAQIDYVEVYGRFRSDFLEKITQGYLMVKYKVKSSLLYHEAEIKVDGRRYPEANAPYSDISADFSMCKKNTFVMYESKADIDQFVRRIVEESKNVSVSWEEILKSVTKFRAAIVQISEEIDSRDLRKVFYLVDFKQNIRKTAAGIDNVDIMFTSFKTSDLADKVLYEVSLTPIAGIRGIIGVVHSNEMEDLLFG